MTLTQGLACAIFRQSVAVNQFQSVIFSLLDSVSHGHSVQRTTAWLLVIQIQSISINQSFWVSQFQFLYHGRTHVICHIMSYDMSLYHVVSWYNSCQIYYYFLSWYILASNVRAWPIISCKIMSWHEIVCQDKLIDLISCHIICNNNCHHVTCKSFHVMAHVMSCQLLSHNISCHATFHMTCLVMSNIMTCHVKSCHDMSHFMPFKTCHISFHVMQFVI